MSDKNSKKIPIKHRLFNKRRLVILNEDTFEEIVSFKLNLMNVFVTLTLGAIFLILITTFIIAFSPLREYIPGYSSTELKKNATQLALKSDSLQTLLHQNEVYLRSIQKVLKGELEYASFNKDSILASAEENIPLEEMKATQAEMNLRENVSKEEAATTKSKTKKTKK
ncbi:peptidase [Flavobacterium agrisoli]|uniref:Peptidase n=1 Tax=Flavobacterium agrisoli TaxID=2793066 RepID=A0A934PMM6_9FLAO|nr:peptidase [Flavobacterium agrisoli]MBK0369619.1 peptidase [Flavobacterium agrisoli]